MANPLFGQANLVPPDIGLPAEANREYGSSRFVLQATKSAMKILQGVQTQHGPLTFHSEQNPAMVDDRLRHQAVLFRPSDHLIYRAPEGVAVKVQMQHDDHHQARQIGLGLRAAQKTVRPGIGPRFVDFADSSFVREGTNRVQLIWTDAQTNVMTAIDLERYAGPSESAQTGVRCLCHVFMRPKIVAAEDEFVEWTWNSLASRRGTESEERTNHCVWMDNTKKDFGNLCSIETGHSASKKERAVKNLIYSHSGEERYANEVMLVFTFHTPDGQLIHLGLPNEHTTLYHWTYTQKILYNRSPRPSRRESMNAQSTFGVQLEELSRTEFYPDELSSIVSPYDIGYRNPNVLFSESILSMSLFEEVKEGMLKKINNEIGPLYSQEDQLQALMDTEALKKVRLIAAHMGRLHGQTIKRAMVINLQTGGSETVEQCGKERFRFPSADLGQTFSCLNNARTFQLADEWVRRQTTINVSLVGVANRYINVRKELETSISLSFTGWHLPSVFDVTPHSVGFETVDGSDVIRFLTQSDAQPNMLDGQGASLTIHRRFFYLLPLVRFAFSLANSYLIAFDQLEEHLCSQYMLGLFESIVINDTQNVQLTSVLRHFVNHAMPMLLFRLLLHHEHLQGFLLTLEQLQAGTMAEEKACQAIARIRQYLEEDKAFFNMHKPAYEHSLGSWEVDRRRS